MNIPCDKKAVCFDPADPFQNLSSEAPDVNHFFGIGSGPGSTRRVPGGPGGGGPPPGGNFSAECLTTQGPFVCVADTQEEANLCVQRNAVICNPPDGDHPGGDPDGDPSGNRTFRSGAALCAATCPDGLPFLFGVRAGLFAASSQILADRMANDYACRQALLHRICLPPLTPAGCVGQSLNIIIAPLIGIGPFSFVVVAGTVPPGCNFVSTPTQARITGTPTTGGNFTVSVKVTSAAGSFMVKTYTIAILELTTASPLPSGTASAAYAQQIDAIGGTPPYTFSVTSGALPAGLTISTPGVISGTPANAETSAFTVRVVDSEGHQCSKNYTLAVASGVGFRICNWAAILAQIDPFVCSASAFPEWDGVFDKVINSDANPGEVYWYFTSKSIRGTKAAPDEDALFNTPGWQDNIAYTRLAFVAGAFWSLELVCQDGAFAYFGRTMVSSDPDDPSGIYSFGTTPPNFDLQIEAVIDSSCCLPIGEDTTIPVPATVVIAQGLPQPTRVRIQNYSSVASAFGSLGFCFPKTTEPAWDGTYPFIDNTAGLRLSWHPQTVANCSGSIFKTPMSINTGVTDSVPLTGTGPCSMVLQYDALDVGAPFWLLKIFCIPPNPLDPLPVVWQGAKRYGTDPTGTYTREAASSGGEGSADGPNCIHIESY